MMWERQQPGKLQGRKQKPAGRHTHLNSEGRKKQGARDAGQLLTALWGAIIEIENTNNILNRKRRLLLKLMLALYTTMAASCFCSHRDPYSPAPRCLSIWDYVPQHHETWKKEIGICLYSLLIQWLQFLSCVCFLFH